MDTTKLNSLERKVYGTNKINELSVLQIKHVLPQLQQFVGKKIRLSDESLSQKLKGSINFIKFDYIPESGENYRVYLYANKHSLYLYNDVTVKDTAYEGVGYGCSYYQNDMYIGRIEDGILTDLESEANLVLRYGKKYDAISQANIQKQIAELESKARELKSQLI